MENNSNYRLYGRTKGRKKKYIKYFDKIKFIEISKNNNNIIDIGSGFGESTIKIARENSDKVVICCEKYIDGLNNLFDKAQEANLNNIFIYEGNVHQLLDKHCNEHSISDVWILFPDPWPKKRHNKRRLIDKFFFLKIYKYLKSDGIINIATDSKSYISQILKTLYIVKENFLWLNQSKSLWDYNPNILPATKYYKKAKENGDNPFYIKLKKL